MHEPTPDSPGPTEQRASAPGGDGQPQAPLDATVLAEEAKAEIRESAERLVDQDDVRHGRTSMSTPTKHEADAVTASRTPSRAAEEALEQALEAEAQESGGAEKDMTDYPTAKEVAEHELADGTGADSET